MTDGTRSQIFYQEIQKIIPALKDIKNVMRVVIDAKVGENPILSVEVLALPSPAEGLLEPITHVFRIVPIEEG